MSLRRVTAVALIATGVALLAGCAMTSGPRATVLPTAPDGAAPTMTASPSTAPTAVPVPVPVPTASDGDAIACDGGPVTVSGADLAAVLTGDCPAVMVGGTGLRVDTTGATVGVIQVSGDRNEIIAGSVSELSVGGQDNAVEAAGVDSAALNGDRNTIRADEVSSVSLAGNDNIVAADAVGTVVDNGQRNTVGAR